jgi:hypothetical protein
MEALTTIVNYFFVCMSGCGVAYTRIVAPFEALPNIDLRDNPPSFEVVAYTALPSHTVRDGQPSKRYLKLLVDGATAHSLPTAYIAQLQTVRCFDCKGTTLPVLRGHVLSHEEVVRHTYNNAFLGGNKTTKVAWAPVEEGEYEGTKDQAKSSEQDGANADSAAVWVCVASLVFDVSGVVQTRAMLRGMTNIMARCKDGSESVDGTRYILQLWENAYRAPIPSPLLMGDNDPHTVHRAVLILWRHLIQWI